MASAKVKFSGAANAEVVTGFWKKTPTVKINETPNMDINLLEYIRSFVVQMSLLSLGRFSKMILYMEIDYN